MSIDFSNVSESLLALQNISRHKPATPETKPPRQAYMAQLGTLYGRLFSKTTKIFDDDSLIQYAFAIAHHGGFGAHHGIRGKLLPKALKEVALLSALEAELLSQTPAPDKVKTHLAEFVDYHGRFNRAFARAVRPLIKDTPYVYKHQTYPKTVALLEQVYEEALEECPRLKPQLEASDPAIFQTIVDLTILKLIAQDMEIPEAFAPYSAEIHKMRGNREIDIDALKDKILSDKNLNSDATIHYKTIGELRTNFERFFPKVHATLMHNLQLEFC